MTNRNVDGGTLLTSSLQDTTVEKGNGNKKNEKDDNFLYDTPLAPSNAGEDKMLHTK
jgi:hypothetical protein